MKGRKERKIYDDPKLKTLSQKFLDSKNFTVKHIKNGNPEYTRFLEAKGHH